MNIEYLSMIIGIAIIMFMMIRGWSPIIIGITATLAVIVLNGLPFGETMTETYFTGFGTIFTSLFPPIFSGCLLAQSYTRSGAVVTIADKLSELVFRVNTKETQRYVTAILTMVLVCGIVCYCGMNSLVVLISMYPIALRIMEKSGIPKRFVMGILSGGVYTFALSAPGSAETVNVLAMQALGTPSYTGIFGGIAAVITEVIIMTVLMTLMIKRAVKKGETFAYGSKDYDFSKDNENKERPNLFIAIIPLAVLILLFNVFLLNIFTATMIGWLTSVVLFFKYSGGMKGLKESCTLGGKTAFGPLSSVASMVGFTTVIQTLPSFQKLIDGIFEMNLSPILILILAISLVAGLTGSSTSAIRIGIPLVAEKCLAAGLSPGFIHRVSCFACSTIDTLPWTTAIIINLDIADLKMKDGYPPMFVATTLATLCGTIVCAAFMYFLPFLP